jgi:hypothetical protein
LGSLASKALNFHKKPSYRINPALLESFERIAQKDKICKKYGIDYKDHFDELNDKPPAEPLF